MGKFLHGNELNFELEKLFEQADSQIIIVSPYVKLHERYMSTLMTKIQNPYVGITLVFGKNEDDMSRSMKQEDFNFFKQFPNVEIRFEKRLHAKYYANERSAILTSMNLYTFSQDNNIEAGVLVSYSATSNMISNFTGEESLDRAAYNYFTRVIEQSQLLYKRSPEFERTMMGLSEKYKSSKTEVDKLSEFFASKTSFDNGRKDKFNTTNAGFQQPTQQNYGASIPKPSIVQSNTSGKLISTTALAKEMGLNSKDLFTKFERLNWIEKKNDEWLLTALGKSKGAQTKNGQYGEYIAWPESVADEIK